MQEAQLWLTGSRSADRLLCDEAIHTCQEAVHSLYVVGAPHLPPNMMYTLNPSLLAVVLVPTRLVPACFLLQIQPQTNFLLTPLLDSVSVDQ